MAISDTIRDVATQGKQIWDLRDMKNAEEERLSAAKFMLAAAKEMADGKAKAEIIKSLEAQIAELEASIKDYYSRIAAFGKEHLSAVRYATRKVRAA